MYDGFYAKTNVVSGYATSLSFFLNFLSTSSGSKSPLSENNCLVRTPESMTRFEHWRSTAWELPQMRIYSPGLHHPIVTARLPIEALGKKIAAYLLKVFAIVYWNKLVVGSSLYTSSPTSASLIALSIPYGALERTSLLKSMNYFFSILKILFIRNL